VCAITAPFPPSRPSPGSLPLFCLPYWRPGSLRPGSSPARSANQPAPSHFSTRSPRCSKTASSFALWEQHISLTASQGTCKLVAFLTKLFTNWVLREATDGVAEGLLELLDVLLVRGRDSVDLVCEVLMVVEMGEGTWQVRTLGHVGQFVLRQSVNVPQECQGNVTSPMVLRA
jgi:hypothetical protein